jgi:hypothetical protein
MMELGAAGGDVLEMELRLCINEPRLTTIRPENRKLQSNSVKMAGLVFSIVTLKNNTVKLVFAYCKSL